MFDLAWSEIMLIGAVALVVIGPKELPGTIRAVSQFIRKAREMAWEFRGHVDEMVREANLDEVRNQINEIRNFDVKGEVAKAVDPDGSLRRTVEEAGQSVHDATRAMDDPARYVPPATDPAPATEPATGSEPAAGSETAAAEAEPPPPALAKSEEPPAFVPPEPIPSPLAPEPVAAEPPPFVPPGTQRN